MISFLGDVYLDKYVKVDFDLDNFIFNLEYPISSRGIPSKNKINLIQKESFIKNSFIKNPIAVCLANNHIMDYGNEAFEDTINFLNKENIKYFGAGNQKNNFNNPLVLKDKNKIISISGYSCKSTNAIFGSDTSNGSALLDLEQIKKNLESHKADFKIVQLHWGMEDIPYPLYTDVNIAHQIIDLGADLIIGHHAHIIQPVEDYKGKKIFYGLGNCVFPDFNLDSHFDGKKFTRMSSKKQRDHNKKSLLINLTNDLKIEYKKLYFNKNILDVKNFKIERFIPKNDLEFEIKYNRYKKIDTIKRFFISPRIPNISQIKRLIKKEKLK